MWTHIACEALRSGHLLDVSYDGFSRLVDVHAVGFADDDTPVMLVWQVSGGSSGSEPQGWKHLHLDEIKDAALSAQKSLAPRPGYAPGDALMKVISCQV